MMINSNKNRRGRMELLQSMQVFARVAELGSFTKAADAIQVGRPQVTRAIQELEATLGVRLFQRTTRHVRLTTEGEQFYERVLDVLGRVAETWTRACRHPGPSRQASAMRAAVGWTRRRGAGDAASSLSRFTQCGAPSSIQWKKAGTKARRLRS